MRWPILVVAGMLVTLAAISASCSKEVRPASTEIEQVVTIGMPAFARLSSFSVEAMQNMGTEVEPVWQSRFRAAVKLTAATFALDGADPGVVFVRPIRQPGETIEVFGKSVSTLYGGKWRTQIDLEGQPIQALGQPESAFGPQKVIVRGSSAEAAYVVEQSEKRRQSILAAQKEAEDQRLASERANEAVQRRLQVELQVLQGTDCNEAAEQIVGMSR